MEMLGNNFSWNETRWLSLLLILPVAFVLILLADKRKRFRLGILALSAGDLKVDQFDGFKASLKLCLIIFTMAAFVISSAGPRLGWRLNEIHQTGMDIVIAIDVSKSMLSQDIQPSRLERARRIVLDLLEAAQGDRVGVVLFAGAAYVQCPLTFDHDAIRTFLVDLDPELVPIGGTDLAAALRESLRALGAGGQNASSALGKLIVLVSDGEGQQGDLDNAIGEVQRSEARVIAVAMGTEMGAPIPSKGGGLLKDDQGRVVVSRLDDKDLRLLAEKTGGHFVNGAGRELSVAEIYQTFFKDSGVVKDQKIIKEKEWFDRYQWSAAIALLLLLVDLFLTDLKKMNALTILAVLIGGVWSMSAEASDRDHYNRVVGAYGSTSIEDSEKVFRSLMDSSDKEVARRSLYNLGNILARQGRFEEAVKSYEQALLINPQDQQVRDNLAWARKYLPADKNQQKADQQKADQQKADQQKADQQKADQQKADQQKADQQKADQQKADQQDSTERHESDVVQSIDRAEAERLLRSVPDEPRRVAPIYRGGDLPKKKPGIDW